MVMAANQNKVQEWVEEFRRVSVVLFMHEVGGNEL
jgi:hypothetical protein